jgi:hypothetical protein
MDNPKVELLDSNVKMAEDLVVVFTVVNKEDTTVIVPESFVSDLASVPKVFWMIVPPFGKYTRAALVHDYLYATQTTTKEIADFIFLILMKRLKVKKWKYKIMYWAVKYFGKWAWNRHKKADEAKIKAERGSYTVGKETFKHRLT